MNKTCEQPLPEEHERVFAHRMEQFLRLHYTPEQAEALAWSDIDHHELASLIERGCSPKLAARILL